MELLIDTHAVIWFITDNAKLPLKTKQIIEDNNNNCYISIASFWEIAIKASLCRLQLDADLDSVFNIIEETGFEILPITNKQILVNAKLDFHHYNPFDRIIIAQAMHEHLSVVTKDEQFGKYNVPVIWKK